MYVIETESVNKGYHHLLDALIKEGETVSPRGEETWEMRPVCWTITNPRKRSFEVVGRWKNLGFQLAECLWILSGADDLATLWHYIPYYNQYSDDTLKLSGAYGKRLRAWPAPNNGHTVDQFQAVYEKLIQDPHSRQAVQIIFNPALDYLPTNDVPCTNWLHYTLRNGKLDLTVVMRSNDALLGIPYNMYNFMTFQEIMAGWLNVEVGTYRHIVDCMHVYKDKLFVVERLRYKLKQAIDIYDYYPPQDARVPKFQFEDILHKLRVVENYSRARHKSWKDIALKAIDDIPNCYWRNYAWALYIYNEIKQGNWMKALPLLKNVTNEFMPSLLQRICRTIYRSDLNPTDYLQEHLHKMPAKLQRWILENPIKEMEAIGMGDEL